MNLFYLLLIVRYSIALLFEKKGTAKVDSSNVIYETDAPSALACAHLCTQQKCDVIYDNKRCKCLRKNGDGNIDSGDNKVTGMLYQTKMKPGKPVKIYHCDIDVLRTNHPNNAGGLYFFFNRDSIKGLTEGDEIKTDVRHSRTGVIKKVKIWGDDSYTPNAHGRYDQGGANGDWQVGDKMIFQDKTYCKTELVF